MLPTMFLLNSLPVAPTVTKLKPEHEPPDGARETHEGASQGKWKFQSMRRRLRFWF